LLKTGHDYYGQFLPAYIHSFSEWRAPLVMYVTAPFIGIFGLNEWGVRLPSAFLGILSVYLLYLLTKRLFKDELIAALSAFFLAASPWHIQYSRAAFELSLLLFLFLAAIYFTLISFKNNWLLLPAAALFSLTLYTYSTANVLLPLILALMIFIFRNEFLNMEKKKILLAFFIFLVMIMPIAREVIFGHAAERFSQFSVFGHQEYIGQINLERAAAGNTLVEKIFHNKPLAWARVIGLNYLSAFSPLFLFERGDVTFRRSIHEMGEIFWVQLPLLIIGIFYLLTRAEKQMKNFWLGWLLIAPIPTSLTWDGANHASRLFLLLPPLMVISSLGLIYVYRILRPARLRVMGIAFISLWFFAGFIIYSHRYWVHYAAESWRWWQFGYKEAMRFMKNNEKEYRTLVFNNSYEPSLPRFLFWWQYPPDKFLKEFKSDKIEKDILAGFNGFSLENRYYFGTLSQTGEIASFIKPDLLYLVSQKDEVGGDWDWGVNPPAKIKVLKAIRNPYGQPIFYIVTGK